MKSKTKDIVFIGASAAIIAVCAWITVPVGAVPITLQTLAVCLVSGLLGYKKGTLSVLVYILLGAVGVPVFSGFKGGVGVLLGATGGYIIGFIFTSLIVGLISEKAEKRFVLIVAGMIAGIAVCYAFGTLWFALVFARSGEEKALSSILSMCVIPFIIPDIVKVVIAALLVQKLHPLISKLK